MDEPVEQATAAPGERRDLSLRCPAYLDVSGSSSLVGNPTGRATYPCVLRLNHDGDHRFDND